MRIPVTKEDAIEALKMCKDSRIFVPSNEVLDHAIDALEKFERLRHLHECGCAADYKRGCHDGWEFARRIRETESDSYTAEELFAMFGTTNRARLLGDYTYDQINEKVEAYNQKKEKEAQKPIRGDEVEVIGMPFEDRIGIYLGENEDYYVLLFEDSVGDFYIDKRRIILKKTGRHVDLFISEQ